MIQNGVDININNGIIINTSILSSINSKSNDLLIWILKNGGDPNLLNNQNLYIAYSSENIELKKILDTVLKKK